LVHETLAVVMKGIETGTLSQAESQLDAVIARHAGSTPAKIFKIDPERRMVYGWGSVATVGGTNLTDRQQDVVDINDLRDAAHDFMKRRVLNRMHEPKADIGDIRESIVFDKGLQDALGIDLGCEGWFVGAYVKDDATWARVKKGELRAFSIEGSGHREPIIEKRLPSGGRTPEGRAWLFRDVLAVVKDVDVAGVHEPVPLPARRRRRKKVKPT